MPTEAVISVASAQAASDAVDLADRSPDGARYEPDDRNQRPGESLAARRRIILRNAVANFKDSADRHLFRVHIDGLFGSARAR